MVSVEKEWEGRERNGTSIEDFESGNTALRLVCTRCAEKGGAVGRTEGAGVNVRWYDGSNNGFEYRVATDA